MYDTDRLSIQVESRHFGSLSHPTMSFCGRLRCYCTVLYCTVLYFTVATLLIDKLVMRSCAA